MVIFIKMETRKLHSLNKIKDIIMIIALILIYGVLKGMILKKRMSTLQMIKEKNYHLINLNIIERKWNILSKETMCLLLTRHLHFGIALTHLPVSHSSNLKGLLINSVMSWTSMRYIVKVVIRMSRFLEKMEAPSTNNSPLPLKSERKWNKRMK